MEVAINMRVAAFQMGGQQRAAAEVANRLAAAIEIKPKSPLCGLAGHLWEQLALPVRAGGRLLWSPSATGPLVYSRQVVTVHDVAFLDVPECFSASFRQLYAKLTPALMRRVAKVVTVSEFSRRRIIERTAVDPNKIVVIGNGVSNQFQIQGSIGDRENAGGASTSGTLFSYQRHFSTQERGPRVASLAVHLAFAAG